MSQIQYVDELIREYLLYRGFSGTLKMFDSELKMDKEKGFRVDKIVDQIMQYIYTCDLNGLRELWGHLEQKMFSKLENEFTSAIRKLESSILKLYVVNAVSNNKADKVTEFFTRLTPELQGQSEWKDWFMLPYVKSPEESPMFSVQFTRTWQDTLMVSLHNFLAIIYQSMPLPVLACYEEEASRVRRLTEENDSLRLRLSSLQQRNTNVSPPPELMDDFYIIAQETPASLEVQGKTLRRLIRTIGGGHPTSPIMGRKPQEFTNTKRHNSKQRLSSTPTSVWGKSPSEGGGASKRSVSLEARSRTKHSPREASLDRTGKLPRQEFLLLSQEEMCEHKSAVTQCQFNATGAVVASCDVDGAVKVWSPAPQPKLLSSHSHKAAVLCLDWVSKNERYLVCGSRVGSIALYDMKEHKTLWDMSVASEDKTRVVCVTCSPSENVFVGACVTEQNQGKLLLYDIKSKKLERSLSLGPGLATLYAACCAYNHNGQLLVCGCSDGTVRTLDLRHGDVVDSWSGHQGAVTQLQLTPDQNHCYSLGTDNKLYRHSFNQPKQPVWETVLPAGVSCFTLDQSASHVLLGGTQGAGIHQVNLEGVQPVLKLSSAPVATCHWANANQCGTCVTAAPDGRIRIFTLLTP
ncbi:WD repeat-containing protein 91 [Macrosteles quadrilineatus]|uniref:WD repeat-containing protein 91 n=1 Tax=Macrosteles quadrilineatus TaxID=74068 RepID=UPI0023E247F6|nr:WD repeat-containing protein 91 [Macrosteles quadrilineatus]XP_054258851.1 WD repeat-containing protein 91 [Macrosteles quadrilineatus]XP_054258852.1 WD repeat-containing protein 91 [Macrosteles quadrilineatus]